jgi:virulence-associated protein VapD
MAHDGEIDQDKLYEARPDLRDEKQVELIFDDIKRNTAIAAFNSSEGGIILRESLYKDVANVVADLAYNYERLDHTAIIKKCVLLGERINLLRVLEKAKPNEEIARKALEDITTA